VTETEATESWMRKKKMLPVWFAWMKRTREGFMEGETIVVLDNKWGVVSALVKAMYVVWRGDAYYMTITNRNEYMIFKKCETSIADSSEQLFGGWGEYISGVNMGKKEIRLDSQFSDLPIYWFADSYYFGHVINHPFVS